jgi:hypothetical protein
MALQVPHLLDDRSMFLFTALPFQTDQTGYGTHISHIRLRW